MVLLVAFCLSAVVLGEPIPDVAKPLIIRFPARQGFVQEDPTASWDTVQGQADNPKDAKKGKIFDLVQQCVAKQKNGTQGRYRVETAYYSDPALSEVILTSNHLENYYPRLAPQRPKGTFTGAKIAREEWHDMLPVCARLQLREGAVVVCVHFYPASVTTVDGTKQNAISPDDIAYLEEVAKKALDAAKKVDGKKLLSLAPKD